MNINHFQYQFLRNPSIFSASKITISSFSKGVGFWSWSSHELRGSILPVGGLEVEGGKKIPIRDPGDHRN